MGDFTGLLRQGFIVISAGSKRVEGQIKLVFPAKFEAGFRHGVIANLRARIALRRVGGVSGNLIGDKPLFNIFFIWQAQMLFRRYVAGIAQPNQPIIAAPIPDVKWS